MDAKTIASTMVTMLGNHFSDNQSPAHSDALSSITSQLLPWLQQNLSNHQALDALKSDPDNQENRSALSDQIASVLRENPNIIPQLQSMLSGSALSKLSDLIGSDTLSKVKGIFDKFMH